MRKKSHVPGDFPAAAAVFEAEMRVRRGADPGGTELRRSEMCQGTGFNRESPVSAQLPVSAAARPASLSAGLRTHWRKPKMRNEAKSSSWLSETFQSRFWGMILSP